MYMAILSESFFSPFAYPFLLFSSLSHVKYLHNLEASSMISSMDPTTRMVMVRNARGTRMISGKYRNGLTVGVVMRERVDQQIGGILLWLEP